MIAIKRSITFSIESKPSSSSKKDEEARLRCTVTWNGNRIRLTLPFVINPNFWEKSLQRVRAKSTHGRLKTPATLINRSIDETEELLTGIFTSFEHCGKMPSRQEVQREYAVLTGLQETPDEKIRNGNIFSAYDNFIADGMVSGRWSKGTLVKVRTVRNHLFAISPTLTFEELDSNGINLLIEHFANVKDNTKKIGLANSTIQTDIAFVKTFLRWAYEHDYCDKSKMLSKKIRLKRAERPVIFLTWEELMRVYNQDFGSQQYLAQVRDVFCFCCFTSLRYSDVHNLRRANVTESDFTITTIKTHDTLTIELNKYSKAILDKYLHIPFPDDKALPVISNQKMNDFLKVMARKCELNTPITITKYKGTTRIDETHEKWELITTHAGRRTFVCNALMLGIPPNIVMRWTGHSDYKSMRPYIAIADDAKRKAMTAFDKI